MSPANFINLWIGFNSAAEEYVLAFLNLINANWHTETQFDLWWIWGKWKD